MMITVRLSAEKWSEAECIRADFINGFVNSSRSEVCVCVCQVNEGMGDLYLHISLARSPL